MPYLRNRNTAQLTPAQRSELTQMAKRTQAALYSDDGRTWRASGRSTAEYAANPPQIKAKAEARYTELKEHLIKQNYSPEAAEAYANAAYEEITGLPREGATTKLPEVELSKAEVAEIQTKTADKYTRTAADIDLKTINQQKAVYQQEATDYNTAVKNFNEQYRVVTPQNYKAAMKAEKDLLAAKTALETKEQLLNATVSGYNQMQQTRYARKTATANFFGSLDTVDKIKYGYYTDVNSPDVVKAAETRIGLGLIGITERSAAIGETVGEKLIGGADALASRGGYEPLPRGTRELILGTTSATASALPASGLLLFGFGEGVKMGTEAMLQASPEQRAAAVPIVAGVSYEVGAGIINKAVTNPFRTAGEVIGTSIVFSGTDVLGTKLGYAIDTAALYGQTKLTQYQLNRAIAKVKAQQTPAPQVARDSGIIKVGGRKELTTAGKEALATVYGRGKNPQLEFRKQVKFYGEKGLQYKPKSGWYAERIKQIDAAKLVAKAERASRGVGTYKVAKPEPRITVKEPSVFKPADAAKLREAYGYGIGQQKGISAADLRASLQAQQAAVFKAQADKALWVDLEKGLAFKTKTYFIDTKGTIGGGKALAIQRQQNILKVATDVTTTFKDMKFVRVDPSRVVEVPTTLSATKSVSAAATAAAKDRTIAYIPTVSLDKDKPKYAPFTPTIFTKLPLDKTEKINLQLNDTLLKTGFSYDIETTKIKEPAFKTAPAVAVSTATVTIPEPIPITTNFIKPRLPDPIKPDKIIEPGKIDLKFDWPAATYKTGGFNKAYKLLVKTKGSWKLKGEGLPIGKALTKGITITGGTAARSFKILPSGFTKLKDVPKPSLKRYYQRKGTLIEKTKFAIDQPGELKEITFKGLATKKFKKKKRLRSLL